MSKSIRFIPQKMDTPPTDQVLHLYNGTHIYDEAFIRRFRTYIPVKESMQLTRCSFYPNKSLNQAFSNRISTFKKPEGVHFEHVMVGEAVIRKRKGKPPPRKKMEQVWDLKKETEKTTELQGLGHQKPLNSREQQKASREKQQKQNTYDWEELIEEWDLDTEARRKLNFQQRKAISYKQGMECDNERRLAGVTTSERKSESEEKRNVPLRIKIQMI